jgi:hypothetical protein
MQHLIGQNWHSIDLKEVVEIFESDFEAGVLSLASAFLVISSSEINPASIANFI